MRNIFQKVIDFVKATKGFSISVSQEKPNILITGATGYLGTNLTDKMRIQGIPFRIFNGDLLTKWQIREACKDMDVVIHLAALIKERKKHTKLFEINVMGTNAVIEACEKNNVKKLIYISTMATLGKAQDGYTKTKRLAEIEVRSSRIPITSIIRSGLIYGGRNKHKLKEVICRLTPQSFLNKPYRTNINLITDAIIKTINVEESVEFNVCNKNKKYLMKEGLI